jgi:hypothetical protein
MRYISILFALTLAACASPMLTQNQAGGVIHNVSVFGQTAAFDMAKDNCAQSGLAVRIVSFPTVYGDVTYLCVKS